MLEKPLKNQSLLEAAPDAIIYKKENMKKLLVIVCYIFSTLFYLGAKEIKVKNGVGTDAMISPHEKKTKPVDSTIDVFSKYYPILNTRHTSPGNRTYYINPVSGNDTSDGLSKTDAWKTFLPVNQLLLAGGDRVVITQPGSFYETLMPITKKKISKPVVIEFAAGEYNIFPDRLIRRKFHISNTNDAPYEPKAVAIYIIKSNNITVKGNNSDFIMRGRMIEVCIDQSKDITFDGINFDYKRPTVSEFTVTKIGDNFADIQIHKDSKYEIRKGKIYWIGEG